MPILIIALLFCSCSPKRDNNVLPLPRYSDMGAASDAGETPSK